MNRKNNFLMLHLSFILSYIIKKIGFIALCLVISGIGFDIFRTFTYKPQYMSSMSAVLKASDSTYSQLEQSETYSKTLEYIFNGQDVKNEIMEKMEVDQLDMECHIINQNSSNIVSIQVIAPTKKESYYSLKYIVNWYQNNAERYHLTYGLDILEDAILDENPIYLNSHLRNFRLGTIYCSIILLIIIACIVYFKQTIKTANDVEKLLDCRLFSKIPKERKKKMGQKKKRRIINDIVKNKFLL